jgi:molybdopterin synthase catalytic subunit/molybdopterin synthase sulfur carrier subunit
MKVRVKLFASARQLAGTDTVEVELGDPATVAQLQWALAEQIPALGNLLRHAMFAVDMEYVSPQAQIMPGADIACIPPVSGG